MKASGKEIAIAELRNHSFIKDKLTESQYNQKKGGAKKHRKEDMIMILTSVIIYLAPDMGLPEAERPASWQDGIISIDGYSIPQDIGGYQVQSHYTITLLRRTSTHNWGSPSEHSNRYGAAKLTSINAKS